MKKNQSVIVIICMGILLLNSYCKSPDPKGTISLSKTEFAPGEQITIKYTAEGKLGPNAWIGVIPSSTPHGDESKNDEFDVSYQYFVATNGAEMTFTAPEQGGDYDFRMNTTDQQGIEITSISFKVVAPTYAVSLKTDKAEYTSGEDITVSFTAPTTLAENAWVGLIPSATKHGNEADNDAADVAYEYLKKRTSGTITFKAPATKGSWDIRLNESDSGGKELASTTFSVK